MTKVRCDLTGCKFNSSCCTSPHKDMETICTKETISLYIDEDIHQLDCKEFTEDFEKPIECNRCQLKKHGGIKLNTEKISFKTVQ